ncbi:hypothetical protein RUM43_000138 [Polyplax serrata]|uniref:Uncharacterized protein n=1 Tax=Polyplax serrata TaxID=468196 RepID=A0AAN8SC16_POLSC
MLLEGCPVIGREHFVVTSKQPDPHSEAPRDPGIRSFLTPCELCFRMDSSREQQEEEPPRRMERPRAFRCRLRCVQRPCIIIEDNEAYDHHQ